MNTNAFNGRIKGGLHLAKEKTVVGIDIGSSKITTLIATATKKGPLTVVGVSSVPSRGIKKGQVVDIDESVSAISSSVEAAERMAGHNVTHSLITVGGSHISSLNSRGVVAVAGGENEISSDDVRRVTEAARAISIPSSREIIHVIPRDFIVDSQEGIKDPVGMTGVRLEVETHIISGASTSMRNLVKCIQQVGVDVEDIVFSGIASAESVLSDTEKELGVALVDIGGGTTSVCLFVEGSVAHSVVLPVGGKNITNDIAIGLRCSLESAEAIKMHLSKKAKKTVLPDKDEEEHLKRGEVKDKRDESIDTSKIGVSEELGVISRKTLVEGIIKPRLTEIFTLIGMEIKRSGYAGLLPAGLVITGGAAETVNMNEVGKDVLRMPIRVATPSGLVGLIDEVSTPGYSSVTGLLRYSQNYSDSSENMLPLGKGFEMRGIINKAIEWLKSFLP